MKELNELQKTMVKLRQECPWDKKQSLESLAKYTIEEAYEVADAIDQKNWEHLKGELGDLLFQVIFQAQIASEQSLFDFKSVVESLNTKLIERHPHVFNKIEENKTEKDIQKDWEQQKNKDRQSVLDDIPNNLPQLLKTSKLTKRAAIIGFDWPNISYVFDKMEEEIQELKQAIKTQNQDEIHDEVGDILFVAVNLARHLNIDPELALRHGNQKFEKRFRAVEKRAKYEKPKETEYNLKYLDDLWNLIKQEIKTKNING